MPLNHNAADDIQLRGDDGRIVLLRRSGTTYRIVTSESNWPGYDGGPSGNRYTTLAQITRRNVGRLSPKWIYTIPNGEPTAVTPVVVDGSWMSTSANECYAPDAGNGRKSGAFSARDQGLVGNAAAGSTRRGGCRKQVFFGPITPIDRAERFTGELQWDTDMADWRLNYKLHSRAARCWESCRRRLRRRRTRRPRLCCRLRQGHGAEVWRFWTVPRPGEPGSETWRGLESASRAAHT